MKLSTVAFLSGKFFMYPYNVQMISLDTKSKATPCQSQIKATYSWSSTDHEFWNECMIFGSSWTHSQKVRNTECIPIWTWNCQSWSLHEPLFSKPIILCTFEFHENLQVKICGIFWGRTTEVQYRAQLCWGIPNKLLSTDQQQVCNKKKTIWQNFSYFWLFLAIYYLICLAFGIMSSLIRGNLDKNCARPPSAVW